MLLGQCTGPRTTKTQGGDVFVRTNAKKAHLVRSFRSSVCCSSHANTCLKRDIRPAERTPLTLLDGLPRGIQRTSCAAQRTAQTAHIRTMNGPTSPCLPVLFSSRQRPFRSGVCEQSAALFSAAFRRPVWTSCSAGGCLHGARVTFNPPHKHHHPGSCPSRSTEPRRASTVKPRPVLFIQRQGVQRGRQMTGCRRRGVTAAPTAGR